MHATVSVKASEDGVPSSFGGSKFTRQWPRCRSRSGSSSRSPSASAIPARTRVAVQFCTPASVYAGAYLKLVDYPAANDQIGVVPVDFLLPGLAMAPEAAETTKEADSGLGPGSVGGRQHGI